MISKELLSEVLGTEVINFKYEETHNILLYHRVEYVGMDNHRQVRADGKINIYELAHKCKEWAGDKYAIMSWLNCKFSVDDNKWWAAFTKFLPNNRHLSKEFRADTEPEAIFKACQWIYDNKENNET